jgi:hypothetical protein
VVGREQAARSEASSEYQRIDAYRFWAFFKSMYFLAITGPLLLPIKGIRPYGMLPETDSKTTREFDNPTRQIVRPPVNLPAESAENHP